MIHHRRSIRLRGYDYSGGGTYFVTTCTAGRRQLFGEVSGDHVNLNVFGHIVANQWLRISKVRRCVLLHEFGIMPDHFHALLSLIPERAKGPVQPRRRLMPESIGAIVAQFKSRVTKRIRELLGNAEQVWQRNYYERILRDEREFEIVRDYILDNPANWNLEREYELIESLRRSRPGRAVGSPLHSADPIAVDCRRGEPTARPR